MAETKFTKVRPVSTVGQSRQEPLKTAVARLYSGAVVTVNCHVPHLFVFTCLQLDNVNNCFHVIIWKQF